MLDAETDGILVIDKPGGITSRDVVDRATAWFPRGTRIGHAGTLDPLATGVLVVCVGRATRLIEYVQRMAKVYRAGIVLGATSDTDDADGILNSVAGAVGPTPAQVQAALAGFVGTFEQVPPAYSAAKITGRRAHELARKGKEVDLQPRPVTIHAIDTIAYAYPNLDVQVRCGKGTYIRSLARDLGQRLGCGGYIGSLRRTEIGSFRAEDAIGLDSDADAARRRLLPIAGAVSELPRLILDAETATRLAHGQHVAAGSDTAGGESAAFDAAGNLLMIVEIDAGVLHARKVLASIQK
jgi:tRNA pseudouridine55 synthase